MVQKSHEQQFLFKETNLIFIYTFDLPNGVNVKQLGKQLYEGEIGKAYLSEGDDLLLAKNAHQTILTEIRAQDRNYFHRDYLSRGRFVRVQLEGFKLHLPADLNYHQADVQVLLNLHSIKVGCFIFWVSDLPPLTPADLISLEFLPERNGSVSLPMSVRRLSSSIIERNAEEETNDLTLDEIFLSYAACLEPYRSMGRAESRAVFDNIRLHSHTYVAMFVMDMSPVTHDTTPEQLVEKYKEDIFDILETRPYYGSLKYHKTRKEKHVDRQVSDIDSREHVAMFLRPNRLLLLSLVQHHKEIYAYTSPRWYLSTLESLELSLLQRQFLDRLGREFYLWRYEKPQDLVRFRDELIRGLDEYYGFSFPKYWLTRRFVTRLREMLDLDVMLAMVQERLNCISDSIAIQYEMEVQQRQDATARAVELLNLIVAVTVSIEIVDKFVSSPQYWMYGVVWLSIAIIFYIMMRIFLLFSKTK